MRKIREVFRLKAQGLSARQIAASVGTARSTVAECLRRAEAVGLSWPLPAELTDAALEERLYPALPRSRIQAPPPDWALVHTELRRPGVTLQLLWEEYQSVHPDGYRYSRFCDLYRTFAGRIDRVMRQEHRAGEKLFVDYAGHTVAVIDRRTGEIRQAQIFVAVLGASNYTYAEATWTQSLPDWLGAHVRALEALGGCPAVVVPDNLRSAVSKPHRYEPDLNPAYQALADHYRVAVIPARVRKPRDKAKAEAGVLLVERWILARLRNHTFFSLWQNNREIQRLLLRLNQRPFRKLPGSRQSTFEAIDQPALKPLAATPFEFAEFKRARVNIDYHIELEGHYYSVPHALVRREVELRYTATTVEVFHRGERVASHRRAAARGHHTTVAAHMPERHRHYAEWSPERLLRWAEKIGPETARCVEGIMARRRHPEQGMRACLGLLRLTDRVGPERLEAACARAVAACAYRLKSVEAILKAGLDRQPPAAPAQPDLPPDHDHIRGADYYQ
jgi:transposase